MHGYNCVYLCHVRQSVKERVTFTLSLPLLHLRLHKTL